MIDFFREPHVMVKWWIGLETFKFASFGLIIADPDFYIYYLFWIWFFISVVVYYKTFPLLKYCVYRSINEENEESRRLFCKMRNHLIFLFLMDLFPFIPLIQGIIRYRCYYLSLSM